MSIVVEMLIESEIGIDEPANGTEEGTEGDTYEDEFFKLAGSDEFLFESFDILLSSIEDKFDTVDDNEEFELLVDDNGIVG
eukprot:CAMPEP_0174818150 /NCGR_PEP_ID=MMETSP1107-20130205/778_1 /TAXON_ID=36770 /ORGANISM="Paraphysomonas vestita, Strain GFlagA" /LENGTH=80 /DNA_ID=CAMNT_0016029613 /DNA_START=427 /DNA_END=665 /DNA_ORIENTATION=+